MDNKEAYDQWAETYDRVKNKTRDLESYAQKSLLKNLSFGSCLEIGCGTGKNTQWLSSRSEQLTAVDFSEEMISHAKTKEYLIKVNFHIADVTKPWDFITSKYDLISFSLVLEHIEDLRYVFKEATKALASEGFLYIGELHPYKQYSGSKARFNTEQGEQRLTCFTHHISEFLGVAASNELKLVQLREFFDDEEKEIPRILGMLFKK